MKHIRAVSGLELPVASTDVWHVQLPFGINAEGRGQEDKGQRTRALLFLALGIATVLQAEADTLWVFENGVGALNLPLNATQLGVDNYRGVHPKPIPRWDVHFWCLEDDRKASTAHLSPLSYNWVATDGVVWGYVHFTLALV